VNATQYLCTWIYTLGEVLKHRLGNNHGVDKYDGSLPLVLQQSLIKCLKQGLLPVLGHVYPFLFCFSTLFVQVLGLDEQRFRVSAKYVLCTYVCVCVCACVRYKNNYISAKKMRVGAMEGSVPVCLLFSHCSTC
jgi:hypothetical protein